MPWKIIVGQLTFFTVSKLLNLSSIIKSIILPYFYLATSLTDLMGLIRMRQAGLNRLARWQAGPDPIERPLTIMFFSFTKQDLTRNLNTDSASLIICYALYYVFPSKLLYTPYPGYSMHSTLTLNVSEYFRIRGSARPMSSPFAWKWISTLWLLP